jgi:hypothetical protein
MERAVTGGTPVHKSAYYWACAVAGDSVDIDGRNVPPPTGRYVSCG